MSKKKKEDKDPDLGTMFPLNEKTKNFPWVNEEEFLKHYTSALRRYVHDQNNWPGRDSTKTHITDLSSSATAFAEAWWCIFEDINYER